MKSLKKNLKLTVHEAWDDFWEQLQWLISSTRQSKVLNSAVIFPVFVGSSTLVYLHQISHRLA
nr:hypothetical protein [uncultured Undibacterium sp.]